jgi:hypothetical protein
MVHDLQWSRRDCPSEQKHHAAAMRLIEQVERALWLVWCVVGGCSLVDGSWCRKLVITAIISRFLVHVFT